MENMFHAGVLAALTGGFLAGSLIADDAVRPNVLFILADDWGWGDLSCHGHPILKTPNLDRFAKEGMEFRQFTADSPVCSPSRAAFITGKYPGRFSIQYIFEPQSKRSCPMPDWLDVHAVMLPRLFHEAGYKTAHFGKWHLTAEDAPSAPSVFEYGYDEACIWTGSNGPQILDLPEKYRPEEYHLLNGQKNDPQLWGVRSEMAVRKAMEFMEANKDQSFFVNLHIHEGHTPLAPLPSSRLPYKDVPEPEQTYYAAVGNADRFLGELFAFLDKNELRDNTIVIFTSDNGPEVPVPNPKDLRFGARGETGGFKGRKRSLFEGGVRVPFVVRWPGRVPAGSVNEKTVLTAVDMLPTLCAAAGVPMPEGYTSDGENMLSAFLGKKILRTKPIFWSYFYTPKVMRGGVEVPWPPVFRKSGGPITGRICRSGTGT
ncbi:MAG: sulfatase [Kiritimatiellales bacterium]